MLLRVIAGMALSQSYMFVELHAAAAAVVVVVAVDGKDLSLSQHQLLPSNWLRSLFLQFAIFWHITGWGKGVNYSNCFKTRPSKLCESQIFTLYSISQKSSPLKNHP